MTRTEQARPICIFCKGARDTHGEYAVGPQSIGIVNEEGQPIGEVTVPTCDMCLVDECRMVIFADGWDAVYLNPK